MNREIRRGGLFKSKFEKENRGGGLFYFEQGNKGGAL